MGLAVIRTIKIKKIFTDAVEAVESSCNSGMLGYYEKRTEEYRLNLLREAGETYLDQNNSLWYVNKNNILQRFSWSSCLAGGGVAIVSIDKEKMEMHFTPYGFDRDALRKTNFVWTTD